MLNTLTILSAMSILFTATMGRAADGKATANCKLVHRILDAQGDSISGSRIEGPSISQLTFSDQKIEFKGFSLKASLSPLCNTSEAQQLSDCSAKSLQAEISKAGIKSKMSVELGGLQKNYEMAQAIVLTSENEQVVAVCKVIIL
jgi:hypothetical protein